MKNLTRQPWIRPKGYALLEKYIDKLKNINCVSAGLAPLWLHDEARRRQAARLWEERQ